MVKQDALISTPSGCYRHKGKSKILTEEADALSISKASVYLQLYQAKQYGSFLLSLREEFIVVDANIRDEGSSIRQGVRLLDFRGGF